MKKVLPLLLLLTTIQTIAQNRLIGFVWYDANYNYTRDAGELPLAGKHLVIRDIWGGQTYDVVTDQNGHYDQRVTGTYYSISFDDSFDEVNFRLADSVTAYNDSYPLIQRNLIFLPNISQTKIGVAIDNGGIWELPAEGSIQDLNVQYGFSDDVITSMPAKLTLQFSPLITLLSSSMLPAVSHAGYVEWDLSSVPASEGWPLNNSDFINCTFSFPPVGDTIAAFQIVPKFIPGLALDFVDSSNNRSYFQVSIAHQPGPAIGPTRGLKWMHTYQGEQADIYLPYLGSVIDTAFAGDDYFLTAIKSHYDSFGNNHPYIFVSRINKDGLPVWETSLDRNEIELPGFEANGVKSTRDGGCIVFGNAYESGYAVFYAFIKLDSAGNLVWKKAFPGNHEESVQNIVVTADNSFLFAGSVQKNEFIRADEYTVDSIPKLDLLVGKISASGDLLWQKQYGGSRDDAAVKIIGLQNGTYMVLGATSSVDRDVNGAHQHAYELDESIDTFFAIEGWILNLDAQGNMLWNKCYGGTRTGYFTDAVESAGGILLEGFTASKDGDLPYYPEKKVELWLLHISTNGGINWSKLYKHYLGYRDDNFVFSGDYGDMDVEHSFTGIGATSDGNFIIGGSLTDRYGTIHSNHGESDFIFLKVNPAGEIIWQKAIGGTDGEFMAGCIVDKHDDIVFGGDAYSPDDDLYGRKIAEFGSTLFGKVGISNVISGQVFVDANNNGIKEPAEHFYSNGRVRSAKAADTVLGYIFNGQFLNNVDTGSYVTAYIPVNNYYTVAPAAHNTSFTGFDQTDEVNFALRPRPNINDLEIQLIPLSIARPGFENHYRIITKNVGTTAITGMVTGLKKDSKQTYVSSSRPYTGLAADSIWWGPRTLNVFESDTIDVVLQNAVPPLLNNGDTLTLTATANPVANDSTASNNIMQVKQLVTGSFDPNDKTEIHGGQLTPVAYSNGEYLQYVIRFQNTGTDTAFFITVKDTLDNKFDLSTLQVLAASHSYDFRLDGNVVTWDFKFIKLVDSVTDEAASHGYVSFKIKPKTALGVGETFSNRAAIYFDFNLPVITNDEKTQISDGNGICAGGNIKYVSNKTGTTYQWQVNTGSGYTNIGNNALYGGATTANLQLTNAGTGMYGYKYRCLVNANTYSAEYQLKFVNTWKGTVSTDWQTASNWSCGSVPDANTDVIIKSGVANYPVVNNSVSCRSIRAAAGVSLLVKAGVQLTLSGQ